MTQKDLTALIQAQRDYFATGATLPVARRKAGLKNLYQALTDREADIAQALRADLGKGTQESYLCEIGMVRSEISHMLRHLSRYARERTVPTPLSQFAARCYRKPSPYGAVLIMSPWNYPVLLTLGPLVDALAAGNTAIVKPSAYSPATSALLAELLSQLFPAEYVAVVTGGREENDLLLGQKFDYIFFTGSKNVGQLVLQKAAEHLTPVTLELGGKSPCIVDETAKIPLAARRIVFGKFLNSGQTCVAPDYLLCHKSAKDELLKHLSMEITRQYGDLSNYGHMISQRHFDRVCSLIDPAKVVWGGQADPERLQITPTVMDRVTWADAAMGQEIFGPVLPVLTYESLDEVIAAVNGQDKPLALYFFSEDKRAIGRITAECAFGGGCINDCVIHLAVPSLGFGGVGESGMGAYHGKAGFDTFSHYKGIVDKKTWLDLPMRYRPYTEQHQRTVRKFMK